MKIKTLIAILSSALLILSYSNAQLVISQYAEEGDIKGIEIWNPTSSDVVLSSTNALEIKVYANGATTSPSTISDTTSTIAAGQVAVYADGGGGSGNAIWDNSSITYTEANFNYNGNDAITISLAGTVLDVIGTVGVSTYWTENGVSTRDQNIALKTGITTGNTSGWSDPSVRFETIASKPLDSSAADAVNLSGFGVAPTGTDSGGDTGGGDTGGGDTGGGDTGGGDTGGGDTGGGDTGGGDTGGGDTGGGDTGGGDTGGGDTGGGDTGGGDTGGGSGDNSTPVGLIISQYVETNSGSTPKGIELWNASGGTIDFSVTALTVYVARTSSGSIGAFGSNSSVSSDTFSLNTGTLEDNAVMVIGTSDIGDYLAAIGNTSQFYVNSYAFNGDDAIQVQLNGVVQDTFGKDNVSDPGSNWGGGDATVKTKDKNIALKTGITTGDVNGWDNPDARFDTVTDSTGADVAPANVDGLTGFGVAPPLPDNTVDTDGDGVNDGDDAFPNDPNETADTDSDGVGDNADAFPNDANESADADGDGVGDNADEFDEDATESADTDGDGVGDNSDVYEGYNDTTIGNFLNDFPQSGGGGLTQQDLLDARVGSTAVSVTDGTATITIQVEQSDDNMATWTSPTEGATTVDLPVTGDASFFRVRAQ